MMPAPTRLVAKRKVRRQRPAAAATKRGGEAAAPPAAQSPAAAAGVPSGAAPGAAPQHKQDAGKAAALRAAGVWGRRDDPDEGSPAASVTSSKGPAKGEEEGSKGPAKQGSGRSGPAASPGSAAAPGPAAEAGSTGSKGPEAAGSREAEAAEAAKHAAVGMETGDYPSQTPVSQCIGQPTHSAAHGPASPTQPTRLRPLCLPACTPSTHLPPPARADRALRRALLLPPPLQMGAGADEELHGIPAGGLKPSTEVAVKEELKKKAVRLLSFCSCWLPTHTCAHSQYSGQAADQGRRCACPCAWLQAAAAAAPGPPSQPGLFSRFLQALTGRRADDDDDTKGGGSSSGTAGRSGGSSTAQQPRHGEEPPAASSSMQLGIAALGLAALPMVAWSEWTLKSTGTCSAELGCGPAGC